MEKRFSSRFPCSGVRAKREVNFIMQPEPEVRATRLLDCSLLPSPKPSKPNLKKTHVFDKMTFKSVK
jgi:hypothetical protein